MLLSSVKATAKIKFTVTTIHNKQCFVIFFAKLWHPINPGFSLTPQFFQAAGGIEILSQRMIRGTDKGPILH